MRTLVLCLALGVFLVAGCGQGAEPVPSKPVQMGSAAAPGAPKKGAVQGAQATFNGPGAANADTRAGSALGGR